MQSRLIRVAALALVAGALAASPAVAAPSWAPVVSFSLLILLLIALADKV